MESKRPIVLNQPEVIRAPAFSARYRNFVSGESNAVLALVIYAATVATLCIAIVERLRHFWTLVSSPLGSLLFAVTFLVPVTCFILATVGSWRTLRRVKQQGRIKANLAEVAQLGIALTAIPLLFWSAYDVPRSLAALSHSLQLLRAPDWRIRTNGSALYLTGEIGDGLGAAIEEAVNQTKTTRILVLDSPGGDVDEAMRIAKVIEVNHLSTGVDHGCASACTLIFAAGRERILLPPGKLGFHDCHDALWYFPCKMRSEENYLVAHGVERRFAHRALEVDPTNVWFPSVAELLDAHVITGTTIQGHQ